MLGAEEGHRIGDAAAVDGIGVRIGEVGLHAFEILRAAPGAPSGCPSLKEVVKMPSYLIIEPGVGFARGVVQDRLACSASGLNGLPFSMPIDFSMSIITLSRSSHGSSCTKRSSDWKKRRS